MLIITQLFACLALVGHHSQVIPAFRISPVISIITVLAVEEVAIIFLLEQAALPAPKLLIVFSAAPPTLKLVVFALMGIILTPQILAQPAQLPAAHVSVLQFVLLVLLDTL